MQQFVNPFENKLVSYHTPNSFYIEQNHSTRKSSTDKFAFFIGIFSVLLILFGFLILILRQRDSAKEEKPNEEEKPKEEVKSIEKEKSKEEEIEGEEIIEDSNS